MRIGYMTNAFGPLVGSGAGVTCIKDAGYLTMGDDAEFFEEISKIGFHSMEVLEGNLTKYESESEVLSEILRKNDAEIMSVCVGANFIYKDAYEDEMAHMERVLKAGQPFGVKYLVVCGGAIRSTGMKDGDIEYMAKCLDELDELAKKYGVVACFHPHLGSLIEQPENIDRLFAISKIAVCPDTAHLQAGGYDPVEFIKKYYDRIGLIHLKDLTDEGVFAPLGTGNVDNDSVIEFVKSKGYDGDWVVECDAYPNDPIAACKQSWDYLQGKLI